MELIPLHLILYDDVFNARGTIAEASVRELAASIEKCGLVQPVVVRPIQGERPYHLVCGHRRFMAVRFLGQPTIKAFVVEMTDQEARIANLQENLERRNLSIMQEARSIQAIYGNNYDTRTVARELGRSSTWVRQRRQLLKYSNLVQSLFEQHGLTPADLSLLENVPEHERDQAALNIVSARVGGIMKPVRRRYGKPRWPRSKKEIEAVIYKMAEGGYDLPGRKCLAWAAGNIEEDELFKIE